MAQQRTALGPAFDGLVDDVVVTSGSLYHTDTVVETYSVLQGYGRRRDLPWLVGWRMELILPLTARRSAPVVADIVVHTTLGWCDYPALSIADDGPPALIIEVASVALRPEDDPRVGIADGKAVAYAACGVAEYLVFDPVGECGPQPLTAWRLGPAGTYAPWEPNADGRWVSAPGIAFAPHGAKLRVYDEAGALIPSYEDLEDLAEVRGRELAALRAEVRLLRGEGE